MRKGEGMLDGLTREQNRATLTKISFAAIMKKTKSLPWMIQCYPIHTGHYNGLASTALDKYLDNTLLFLCNFGFAAVLFLEKKTFRP